MRRFFPGIFILMCIVGVIVGTIWLSSNMVKTAVPQTRKEQLTPLIKTSYPQVRDFAQLKSWIGTAQSKVKLSIIALSDGKITYIDHKDEQSVGKGEVLFRIGGKRISARLVSLKRKIDALKKGLYIARKTLRLKRLAVKEGLARADELSAAQSSVIAVQLDLKDAQTRLATLRDSLSILSPIKGIFTNRRVSLGQWVSKGAELAEIVDPHKILVIAKAFIGSPELLVGHSVTVNTPSGRELPGTITRVLPKYNAQGAAILWIEGPQLDTGLKPGQKVHGMIHTCVHKGVLCVPRSAIVYDDSERPYVYVKSPTGYKKRAVKKGLSTGGWVEIISGIKAQDQVVVQGGYELYYREFKKAYKVAD